MHWGNNRQVLKTVSESWPPNCYYWDTRGVSKAKRIYRTLQYSVDSRQSILRPQPYGPLFTLISRSRSTGCLQMGHRSVWNLRTLAQPLHMHCTKTQNLVEIQEKIRKILKLLHAKVISCLQISKTTWHPTREATQTTWHPTSEATLLCISTRRKSWNKEEC